MNIYGTEIYKKELEELEEKVFSNIDEDCICSHSDLGYGYSYKYYHYLIQRGKKTYSGYYFELLKDGEKIFDWKASGYGVLTQIITHSNGKKYLLYGEDVYGYSVLDLETFENVHYIPERSKRGLGDGCDETFIWRKAFYDTQSDILAVDGFYISEWPSVIFMDFSDPMEIKEYSKWLCLGDNGCFAEPHFTVDGLERINNLLTGHKWTGRTFSFALLYFDGKTGERIERPFEIEKEEIIKRLKEIEK